MNLKLIGIFLLAGILITGYGYADSIILKSGQKIEGKILKKTDKDITIELDGVTRTYLNNEVENIDAMPGAETAGDNSVKSNDKEILAKKHFLKAVEQYQNNDLDQAIAEFGKAIEMDPNYAEAYAFRGRLYAVKKEYRLADDDLDQAIKINPKLPNPYAVKAVLHARQGNFKQAIEEYNKAIEISPQFRKTMFQPINIAIAKLPNPGERYYNRAILYYFEGD